MSIEYDKDFGIMTVECDGPDCCDSEVVDADEWQDGIDQIKEMDWLIKLHDDIWYHLCPECKANGVKVEDL